jgi:hypothetical protein
MKTINIKLTTLFLLILTMCACQPPELHHIIVNTTDENLAVKYKLAICGGSDFRGSWKPETQSEADFKKDGAWTSLRSEEFTLEKGTEIAEPPNASPKARCDTETYALNVAPHTAVRIHKGDFDTTRTLNLLELKGQKGKIKYEGTAALIMENFKSYSNSKLNFLGNSLAVLWY